MRKGAIISRKPERLDKAFGGRVKSAMRRAGVGTKELATEAGVHPVTVSAWRRGRKPEPAQLRWLAERLKTPFKWLNSGEGHFADTEPSAQAELPALPGAGRLVRGALDHAIIDLDRARTTLAHLRATLGVTSAGPGETGWIGAARASGAGSDTPPQGEAPPDSETG